MSTRMLCVCVHVCVCVCVYRYLRIFVCLCATEAAEPGACRARALQEKVLVEH